MAKDREARIDYARNFVRDALDEVSDPKTMPKDEYRELLEELISDFEMSLDCVKEEMAEEDAK